MSAASRRGAKQCVCYACYGVLKQQQPSVRNIKTLVDACKSYCRNGNTYTALKRDRKTVEISLIKIMISFRFACLKTYALFFVGEHTKPSGAMVGTGYFPQDDYHLNVRENGKKDFYRS